ncbi:MAG: bifunctional alpha,alpha-trehalose-phosphate synthase (UDP-forming)/trehalose-phosphatase [Bacteroidales bacterium]|nr:bifunctional alpha,alpha-trehalose-phosphate synthase (UDP-forming)/trehalose-phosphatase [Bacteroidales bacterium]
MQRIIIVSNRLPINISIFNGQINVEPSVGGLATGMSSVHKFYETVWIGWPGLDFDTLDFTLLDDINRKLEENNCIPVYLNENEMENYYFGFSNKTIWPLYHYFTQYVEYEDVFWHAYVDVNKRFAEKVLDFIKDDDIIWVHDYHLQLLPKMIKDARPDMLIGFFLHIPFPSFELFRSLPWRREIIEGMLGADLLGFHTYDYERHFISSVRRLLGYDINLNQISFENRIVKVDSFPMGIDYERYNKAATKLKDKHEKDKTQMAKEIESLIALIPDIKLILSIDRLDYTKGIANRLRAYEYFLEQFPQFHKKVTLIMLCVPSRSNVEQYQAMKSEVDELVGRINGKYASINWTPVLYFYRSLPFESLIELYTYSDIALITPIRDGMNLVAKEYLATRINGRGVLILSEMAGAAKEMGEAITINPNNYGEIADALNAAILMPDKEQEERIAVLQNRLSRYNIEKWTKDFLSSLTNTIVARNRYATKKLVADEELKMLNAYSKAKKRILFLDYDGTLVGFQKKPELASPDEELYQLLDQLAMKKDTEVVLISGRDKETFTEWFAKKNYSLITEHGVWIKEPRSDWDLVEKVNNEWKELIRPLIEFYVDRTPGSFVEEKNFSLVWHFRKCDPDLGNLRAIELKDELTSLIANRNIEILEGNKVIEIKNSGINKGRAASKKITGEDYDFILGIGDDWTDEYLFNELPGAAFTIKVGMVNTLARYNLESFNDVRKLLRKLTEIDV